MKHSFFTKKKPSKSGRRSGFTLVETVIAMGIITIMITAFLAAFGPAVQGIRKSMSAKEANRLATTLENELSILRAGDQANNYSTAFEKAYKWIKASGGNGKDGIVLLYQYRGDPTSVREDGTLNPQTDRSKQVPGEDYVLQSVVRRLSDAEVSEELAPGVVEGRVFYVRMNQLIFNNGELVLTNNPGQIIDPTEPRANTDSHENYPEAVIAFQAQFYVLRSSIYAYVNNTFSLADNNGDGHPDDTGKPVFTRNMAIRR
ncbi:MAG: type II secretion system GspH family protein [Verrucomicrobiae bacterium]|nr:type II secretion system GspH family protein [Verrucomicrobiae bacterium]NNJ86242.1 type II secretion system protein [Akkermansiaceae bacterium]